MYDRPFGVKPRSRATSDKSFADLRINVEDNLISNKEAYGHSYAMIHGHLMRNIRNIFYDLQAAYPPLLACVAIRGTKSARKLVRSIEGFNLSVQDGCASSHLEYWCHSVG